MPRPPETPAVFVVEDDTDLRDALSFRLRAAGLPVRAYATAEAFLAEHTPDMLGCLVTDVRLPRMDGVSLIGTLSDRGNRLPIIVISGHAETPLVVDAMRAGAVDFLEKPLDPAAVVASVRAAMQGASTAASLRSEAARMADRLAVLSPREREVFDRFAVNVTTKQVADALSLSPKTVESHRARLLEKLGADSPSALVRLSVLVALFSPHAGEGDPERPESGIS
ncbi:Two-component nitrogen fixation transcriptional regulator FixJ (plasmid) [Rhodovastum atsumiense]|nr:response regulator [Rhodovastum atsumiense]CAH2605834.1 Two-component nitrogen fixation transcriptional regulator FixJ [Rhodovastum atsumiense]